MENKIINWSLLEGKRRWIFKIPIKGLSEKEIQELLENLRAQM